MMNRAYYSNPIHKFLKDGDEEILGILAARHQFALEDFQKNAWLEQIRILKRALAGFIDGHILFEYAIPRMGKRADVVTILGGVVFDAAQRAWSLGQTAAFMQRKKGVADFRMSEPEFLIGVMDRQSAPL